MSVAPAALLFDAQTLRSFQTVEDGGRLGGGADENVGVGQTIDATGNQGMRHEFRCRLYFGLFLLVDL